MIRLGVLRRPSRLLCIRRRACVARRVLLPPTALLLGCGPLLSVWLVYGCMMLSVLLLVLLVPSSPSMLRAVV